jgi:hypothetical protein
MLLDLKKKAIMWLTQIIGDIVRILEEVVLLLQQLHAADLVCLGSLCSLTVLQETLFFGIDISAWNLAMQLALICLFMIETLSKGHVCILQSAGFEFGGILFALL